MAFKPTKSAYGDYYLDKKGFSYSSAHDAWRADEKYEWEEKQKQKKIEKEEKQREREYQLRQKSLANTDPVILDYTPVSSSSSPTDWGSIAIGLVSGALTLFICLIAAGLSIGVGLVSCLFGIYIAKALSFGLTLLAWGTGFFVCFYFLQFVFKIISKVIGCKEENVGRTIDILLITGLLGYVLT